MDGYLAGLGQGSTEGAPSSAWTGASESDLTSPNAVVSVLLNGGQPLSRKSHSLVLAYSKRHQLHRLPHVTHLPANIVFCRSWRGGKRPIRSCDRRNSIIPGLETARAGFPRAGMAYRSSWLYISTHDRSWAVGRATPGCRLHFGRLTRRFAR